MSVAIVVVESAVTPDTLGPWIEGDPRVVVVSAARIAEIPRWVDHIVAPHVVVAGREANAKMARLAANLLAGARPRVAVATRVAPTTGLALAASGLTANELESDPVRVLHTFDALVAQSVSGAVLRSVTKLDFPKPSFGMHLRSVFGRDFVAQTTPTPQVAKEVTMPLEGQPVLVGAQPDTAAYNAVTRLVGAHPVQVVPELVDPALAYHSKGAEFVALAGVSVTVTDRALCPVCQSAAADPVCPFCRVHLRVSEPA